METPYQFLGEGQENDGNNLKIYCRLRPVEERVSCFTTSGTTKLISIRQLATSNEQLQYTFKYVFPPNSSQKDVFDEVAFPLVHKVLQGHNSLLFTYGNTGSGKTYTMKGTMEESGIIPRCLDVIFNSISKKLANKCVVMSDKFNGFMIQSEKKAADDAYQAYLKEVGCSKGVKAKIEKKQSSDPDFSRRFVDPSHILLTNNSNTFAVFITFVQVYNNAVYDLLDSSFENSRKPEPKIIHEDSNKNMYVNGATEVEVSSTEEAYKIFYKGLKKRKVAETLLNTHSSRSHSVFTIRVVQANLSNKKTVKLVGQKHKQYISIIVGQLSLVDLAGSERAKRTQNIGKQLAEAGNINNSLMTLRQCFEVIKKNQRGGSKIIPYRDSKLTTLLKHFFEGDGSISMISCINPHVDNYSESLHVLKFAESTQKIVLTASLGENLEEVETKQKEIQAVHLKIQALEHQKNTLFSDLKCARECETQYTQQMPPPVHFPSPDHEEGKKKMYEDIVVGFTFMQNKLESLVSTTKSSENVTPGLISQTKRRFKSWEEKETSVASFRQELKTEMAVEGNINVLEKKQQESLTDTKNRVEQLEQVLEIKVKRDDVKNEKNSKKIKENLDDEIEKLKRIKCELEMELQNIRAKPAQMQCVQPDEIISTMQSKTCCRAKTNKLATQSSALSTLTITHSKLRPTAVKASVAVSNCRHRRSRSTGDVEVKYKLAMPVPLITVRRPSISLHTSITNLTDVKQVAQGASKYCLMTQTQDSDCDLETTVYEISSDSSPEIVPLEDINDPQPSCSYAKGHIAHLRRFR